MEYLEVSPYGIIGKDFKTLTYALNMDVVSGLPSTNHEGSELIGAVVEIPVGKRKYVGVVLAVVGKPKFECKEIIRVLTDKPIPPQLLLLHRWLSEYYSTHPGTVWQTMLPSGLNKNRRKSIIRSDLISDASSNIRSDLINLTIDQQKAITKILQMKTGTAMLHGITGSGKTEVYKALAMEAVSRGKSSIILVPEISLTAQLVSEFKKNFESVIVTHSKQTDAERHQTWLSVLSADKPTIVIGPRSALFMPVVNLGLIIVDECHEPSYKQEKAPRYNTLRAASILADRTKSRLVLGSATPLIADYYTAKKLNRPIIKMASLAKKDAVRPKTEIIDMTKRDNFLDSQIFTRPLLGEMTKCLEAGKQILLFHNRRGTASVTLCENCGWHALCPRCFIPFTLHADKHKLRCHICGHSDRPPTSCPECHEADVIHRGIGTKRIEEDTSRLFPSAKIKRFDGDSIKGEGVHDLFDELKTGKVDIIIGTQTIAKGLDLPKLALVGIVQADAGLMLPDFSSAERTFQLIAQATGRVGRSKQPTKAIIQTYQPNHPAVIFGVNQDFEGFYDYEIKNRMKGHFPPFTHLLKLTNSYKTEQGAIKSARNLATSLSSTLHPQSSILGPTPAFYERQRGNYRWQIVVRAKNRTDLIKITEKVPPTHWQSELDPNSLI